LDFIEFGIDVNIMKDGVVVATKTITTGTQAMELPVGTYQIVVVDNDLVNKLKFKRTTASNPIQVTVPNDGVATQYIGYTAAPAGSVEVTVYFDQNANANFNANDDKHLKDVLVILEAEGGLMKKTSKTNSQGLVTFDNLPLFDTYSVKIDETTQEFNIKTQNTLPSGEFSVQESVTNEFFRGYRTGKLSNDTKEQDQKESVIIPPGFGDLFGLFGG